MKFYVTEKLSDKRSLTPEKYLLIEDVPICRTGFQMYGPGESPVDVGPDGVVRIERSPEEVFRPETIASFQGKPLVDEHPDVDVDHENWNELARGVVINPRRGVGIYDDVLLADIMVTHRDTIETINRGKKELSCGYSAEYEQTAPGRGRQYDIIGNHVALVEAGRCGPRCAFGDKAGEVEVEPTASESSCSCNNLTGRSLAMKIKDRILAAFKSKDEKALTDALAEVQEETNGTAVHVHVHDEKKEEEEEEERKKSKTTDALDARLRDVEKEQKEMKEKVDDISKDVKKILDKSEEEEEKESEEVKKAEDEKLNALGLESPPGTSDDDVKKTKDSALLELSFQETVALAEVLSPGISMPTFDKASNPLTTAKNLCAFRRKVIDRAAANNVEIQNFVDDLLNGRTLDSMNCHRVLDVYRSVGMFAKRRNNNSSRVSGFDGTELTGAEAQGRNLQTIADINKRNAEFWKNQ